MSHLASGTYKSFCRQPRILRPGDAESKSCRAASGSVDHSEGDLEAIDLLEWALFVPSQVLLAPFISVACQDHHQLSPPLHIRDNFQMIIVNSSSSRTPIFVIQLVSALAPS